MKRMMTGAAILAATVALTPLQMAAQQGRMGWGRGMGMRAGAMAHARNDSLRGPGAEAVLHMRKQLALTDAQVKQLDQIREEAVKQRVAHLTQMVELRSRIRAGELKPADARKEMQVGWKAAMKTRAQQVERVRSLLNDTQRQKITTMRARARAFMMGRRSAMRGGRGAWMRGRWGGFRGERGMARRFRAGMWGGGFGHGMGSGFGPAWGMRQGMGPASAPMPRPPAPGDGGGPAGAVPPDSVPPVGG